MISSQTADILIIDDFHPVFNETLINNGLSIDYRPDFPSQFSSNDLKGFPIIAHRSKVHFSASLIDELPDLICLARGGAGMDTIDEAHAISKGITLLNAPEGNRDAVAEHCIGLLLNLSKNISRSYNEVKNFEWKREENRGWELGGKTIGLIGYGNTGSAVAKKLSGFDMKVLAYDKYLDFESKYAEKTTLDQLLKYSDIVSFHIPLTPETKGILNSEMIDSMKDGVVILNTSRGKICRLSDVNEGIRRGKIKCFATDVLENENIQNLNSEEKQLISSLMSNNQVIITPHIAGWSNESYEKIAEVLARKIIDFTMKVKNIKMKVD